MSGRVTDGPPRQQRHRPRRTSTVGRPVAQRVERVATHLNPAAPTSAWRHVTDDDVVIVSAVRTAITRANKGAFKNTVPEDLLATVLKAVVEKAGVPAAIVQDIQVGNVLPPGGGALNARQAMFYAGFPSTTSLATLNRQCSSGLQAVANIVAAIRAGYIDVGIGAGVESMTLHYGPQTYPERMSEAMSDVQLAADCLVPMGITSENVAEHFKVDREKQDRLAEASHAKALRAQKEGLFTEIVPVTTKVIEKDGEEKTVTVTQDEGPREGTTLKALLKLSPAFKEDGSTTAGNSSQVSDGAAAVLLMTRKMAKKLGAKPLARFLSFAVVGVPPDVMGIGPAFAIPLALQQAQVTKDDIDVYEINEAFASQAVYCCEKLQLDMAKVNPLGGAIALGHPLGCTGARQIATIIPELQRRKARLGCMSMCIGTGMGAAAVIQTE